MKTWIEAAPRRERIHLISEKVKWKCIKVEV